jgi:hypothetical protein
MPKFKEPGHCSVPVLGHGSETVTKDTEHLMLGTYGDWM